MRPGGNRAAELLVLLGHSTFDLLDLDLYASRLIRKLDFGAPELSIEERTLNLEPGNPLQTPGQAGPAHEGDKPLRGIPLPRTHAIAVVVRKHMMKIMVPLAVGEHCDDRIVARRIVFRIRLRAPDMRQRIDEKRHVMTHHEPQNPREQERSQDIAAGPSE